MRIISGCYKGRRLCSFSADFIRPMTDRVKTSVFNILCSKLGGMEGQKVLDLFSGTGNLALEALSRGAGEISMVDSHKKAIQIIRENYQLLKHADPLGQVNIYQKDVFRFLSAYEGKAFDLIFADPPFKKHYGEKILRACAFSNAVGQSTTLVLEISAQEKTPKKTPKKTPGKNKGYTLDTVKKYGDKKVLFYSFA